MNIDSIKVGLPVYVKIGKQKVPGTILDFADSFEGDYLQCKIELEVEDKASGRMMSQVYPKPIQSYRLTHRDSRLSRTR